MTSVVQESLAIAKMTARCYSP